MNETLLKINLSIFHFECEIELILLVSTPIAMHFDHPCTKLSGNFSSLTDNGRR